MDIPHKHRLHRRNTSIRIPHLRPRNHPPLDDLGRFRAEVGRIPQHEICEFAHFDRADEVAHTLRDGRVDGVLTNIPLDAKIISIRAFIFREETSLNLDAHTQSATEPAFNKNNHNTIALVCICICI